MSIADNAQAHALLIDGQDARTAATRTVRDPATGDPIAEVEAGTVWINERLSIGSEMPHGGVKHVVFELTGAPRKEWCDDVSSPE